MDDALFCIIALFFFYNNQMGVWDRLRQTVFEMRCVWRCCCLYFQGSGENE